MNGIVVAPRGPFTRVTWRPIVTGQLDPVDVARFVRRVDISGGMNACWPWMGPIPQNGYGRTPRYGRTVTTHRFALELGLERPIAEGMQACHTCDNRACCNPGHLYEGTAADNNRDMHERGRAFPPPRHTNFARGERVNTAKLTAGQVREIRSSPLSNREIATHFAIDDSTVSRIRSRQYWGHVR